MVDCVVDYNIYVVYYKVDCSVYIVYYTVDCSVYVVYYTVDCSVYVVYYTVDCSVSVVHCMIDCLIDQCVVFCTNYDFSSMIAIPFPFHCKIIMSKSIKEEISV